MARVRESLMADDLEFVADQLDTIAEHDLAVEAAHADSGDKDDAISDARQALRRARMEIKAAIEDLERAGLTFGE